MADFVGFRTPLWLRRLLTMLPAFVVVAIGVDPTRALVISQVVLSLALPVPMIALMIFVFRRDHDGGVFARPDDPRRRAGRDGGCARAQHGVVGAVSRGMIRSATRPIAGVGQQGPIARDGRANTQDDAGRAGSGDPLR